MIQSGYCPNLFEFCFNYLKHHTSFLSSFPSFWLSKNSRQRLNILLKNRINLKSLFTGVKQFLEKSICSISFSIWSAAAAFCNRSHFKWIECDVLPPLGTILNQGRATQNTFESGISSHKIWVNLFWISKSYLYHILKSKFYGCFPLQKAIKTIMELTCIWAAVLSAI